MKAESEMAAKLLEKDIHEKQDTIVSLRQQLEDIKEINLEMYRKLMVSPLLIGIFILLCTFCVSFSRNSCCPSAPRVPTSGVSTYSCHKTRLKKIGNSSWFERRKGFTQNLFQVGRWNARWRRLSLSFLLFLSLCFMTFFRVLFLDCGGHVIFV